MAAPSQQTIGFIGTGVMGSRMAPHVANAGYPVHVYDIDPSAAAALARAHNGIVAEVTAKAVAAACDAVITMLPAGAEVRAAAFGADGLVEGFAPGKVLIDMSSSEPWLTVALAEELAERGIAMFDAPVSGGAAGAEAGTLSIMVGGEDDIVAPWLGMLETMAGHVFRTGKVGSGHAIKTLNNLLSGLNTVAAAETLLIGKRFGLDPAIMVDVFNESTGMNSATKRNMKQQVLTRKFGGGFSFDLKFKDYEIAMKLARKTRTPVPLSGLCFELYEAARGFLEPGCSATAIVRWMEHIAGTELTSDTIPDP